MKTSTRRRTPSRHGLGTRPTDHHPPAVAVLPSDATADPSRLAFRRCDMAIYCLECGDEIVGETRVCIECDKAMCVRCYNLDSICTDCYEEDDE